jgi:hypothetical protein
VEQLPYAPSCDNNKDYILEVLRQVFADRKLVLEIASGTGQHACYFAQQLPWLSWQPTEIPDNLPMLQPRCALYQGDNLLREVALDVCDDPWPMAVPDAVFGANFLHIISWTAVRDFFNRLVEAGVEDVVLAIYGPFNYGGRYTSDSNAQFDQWLSQRDPASAIRNFEDVDALAAGAGFSLEDDYEMPANNRILVWAKKPAA